MNSDIQKIQKFTDLRVWQEGHKLVLMVYDAIKNFPKDEKFGLIDQMRRCVVSITSNIAEGFSRYSSKEKVQFFNIAKGSLTELQDQLIICRDVSYLDKAAFTRIAEQSVVVHKLLNGLLRAIRDKKYEK